MAKKVARKTSRKMVGPKPKQAVTAGVAKASLGKAEVVKIQGLLKSKTVEGVTLAIALLESLGGKRADAEAVFGDRIISALVRDPKVSEATVRRWGMLLAAIEPYPKLLERFMHHATKTVNERKGWLGLNGIEELSVYAAKALAARKCFWEEGLHLKGLKVLEPDVAKALAGFSGSLELEGLAKLSAGAATALASHRGGSINLDGLRQLADEAGVALAKHRGVSLSLNGLSELSPALAKAFAGYKGNDLRLDGIHEISDEAAEEFVMRHKGWLHLNGLSTLSAKAAGALASGKRFLALDGVTTLSSRAAQELAKHRGILQLGLAELTPEVAKALAGHKRLELSSLRRLSDDAAEALSHYQGDYLYLPDVASLSPRAARALKANGCIGLPDRFDRCE